MSAASRKGAAFETLIVDGLKARLNDDRIERRTKNGTRDRGDVTGMKAIRGGRIVLELKNHKTFELGKWWDEAQVERGHDDATVAAVVFKRPRITDPMQQYVLMDVETLCRLVEGGPGLDDLLTPDTHTEVTS